MRPEASFLTRYNALAGPIFLVLTAAFGLAVIIQIFLAGEASMIEPDNWARHVAWVHLFQWLSVPLPFAAYLARRRLGFAALNCTPVVIIGLQYVLIHRAIEQARAPFAGLHAVCGALLLAYVAFVLQEWRQRSR
jgi:mercuric ion transport protein